MSASVLDRARQYLCRVEPAVSGQGGHNTTFRACCALVHGFGLSSEEALPLLRTWNERCQPPWHDGELLHKLSDALNARCDRPRGYLLAETPAPLANAGEARSTAAVIANSGERGRPDRHGFGAGTVGQVQRLAAMRPFDVAGLLWARARGVLVFGRWREFDCFGLTDRSERLLEIRRMDGAPFPAVHGTPLGERKSHAVKHSQKSWPVGILEASPFPCIALVEGVPDFLEAHCVALFEQGRDLNGAGVRCAPVAMLSAAPAIAEEALSHFAGKTVRIFPHAESAGVRAAEKWQRQLEAAGASHIDFFDFSPYRQQNGEPVKDLYNWRSLSTEARKSDSSLWKILPQ